MNAVNVAAEENLVGGIEHRGEPQATGIDQRTRVRRGKSLVLVDDRALVVFVAIKVQLIAQDAADTEQGNDHNRCCGKGAQVEYVLQRNVPSVLARQLGTTNANTRISDHGALATSR